MKYQYEDEIKIPFEEKVFILPEPRQKLFYNLIENYKVFCPKLELIYASLNFNPEIPVDYLLIFTANINGIDIVLWDCPYLYTNKTIPAYRYICKNGLYEQFFRFCTASICRTMAPKFYEFIQSDLCKLSIDKNSPKYWKLPENANTLLGPLVELSLQYVPDPSIKGIRVDFHKKDTAKKSNEVK